MPGLLGTPLVLNEASRTGLAVTLNSTTTVTSSGLFLAADVGREFTVSSSGIPSDTKVTAFATSSSITISNAATVSASRTATVGARLYQQDNQATLNPTHTKLDAVNLVTTFTTGQAGKVLAVMSCPEFGFPSTSADTYLEWSIMLGDDSVLAPNTAGGVGRRVLLGQNFSRRAKMEFELDLSPLTAYTVYWGSACGNQTDGLGAGTGYALRMGGTRGPGVIEFWDLDVAGASPDNRAVPRGVHRGLHRGAA